MMMQLSIKWLVFLGCNITQGIAAVFVEALKFDHNFHEIKLFKTEPYKYYDRWISKKDNDYMQSWKERISGEIKLLRWSN